MREVSFDHYVIKPGEKVLASWLADFQSSNPYTQYGGKCTVNGKCKEPAQYLTGYWYVTGREGRVSRSERRACDKCAKKFMRRHGLTAVEVADQGLVPGWEVEKGR